VLTFEVVLIAIKNTPPISKVKNQYSKNTVYSPKLLADSPMIRHLVSRPVLQNKLHQRGIFYRDNLVIKIMLLAKYKVHQWYEINKQETTISYLMFLIFKLHSKTINKNPKP
jgi:hypothetical protein